MENIQIFHSRAELVQSAADQFITIASSAIKDRACFSAALSGGSTPLPLYRALANRKTAALDWDRIHFFWGDERHVPPGHPESNFNLANQALLQPRSIPAANIHRIQAELPAYDAAQRYQEEILTWFQQTPPRFDLILLGMGDDGHTASLFPNTKVTASPEEYQWVAANFVSQLDTWRITFTPRLLNQARNIIFLVSGANKAKPLQQILEGPYQPTTYPSQLVNPENGTITWLIDSDAAGLLEYKPEQKSMNPSNHNPT